MKHLSLLIVALFLSACEGAPAEHILKPGTNAEAAGCYCSLRMKEGVIIYKTSAPPVPQDCIEETQRDKIVVFNGSLFICAGTDGWKDSQQ